MTRKEREVVERWTSRRDELKLLHASVDGATLCEVVLNDLDELLTSRGEETMTLAEAANLTGYSKDHLSRLIRTGQIRNAGRKHRPRVVVRDLPLRPRNIAGSKGTGYDPNTDARSLRVRR